MTLAFLNSTVIVVTVIIIAVLLELSNMETRKRIAELEEKINKIPKEK